MPSNYIKSHQIISKLFQLEYTYMYQQLKRLRNKKQFYHSIYNIFEKKIK